MASLWKDPGVSAGLIPTRNGEKIPFMDRFHKMIRKKGGFITFFSYEGPILFEGGAFPGLNYTSADAERSRCMNTLILLIALAPPLAAQDLLGTWEAQTRLSEVEGTTLVTVRMTFEADRGMQMEYHFDDFVDPIMALLVEGEDVELPPLQMSVFYKGTYELVETRIHVDLAVAKITVGGLDPVEGMVEYLRALLPVLAEIEGISEDDYPVYEEDALAEFRESFDVEDMKEGMALDLDTLGTYELKEGVLAITTDPEEGGELETILLERVDESSAVRAVTWGQLKAR